VKIDIGSIFKLFHGQTTEETASMVTAL